jgi:hypothetical protein
MQNKICNAAIRFMRTQGMTSLTPAQVAVLKAEAAKVMAVNLGELAVLARDHAAGRAARWYAGDDGSNSPFMLRLNAIAAPVGRAVLAA